MSAGEGITVSMGFAFTVTVTLADPVHPAAVWEITL
jgi:hypothetical protein